MPYVDNQGIHIHYKVEGEGPPLIMQHGSASNLMEWYENGYVEQLKSSYQLILIDARGHGDSDKPHDQSAYSLALRVSDIVEVLDHLGVQKAHYLGYSMGGWIGFGMAKYAPQRIHSFMLGGAHAYADTVDAFVNIDGSDPDRFIKAMEQFTKSPITGASRDQLLDNDFMALSAAMQGRDSLEAILPTMKMPCFLFTGKEDPRASKTQACINQIADATFMAISGLDHDQAIIRSDLILPQLEKFLQGLTPKPM